MVIQAAREHFLKDDGSENKKKWASVKIRVSSTADKRDGSVTQIFSKPAEVTGARWEPARLSPRNSYCWRVRAAPVHD